MDQSSEWIDGKCLVITDRTALPPRCVRTNQPVSEQECRTMDLPWLPTALKVAMCVVPFLLLFGPYAVRRRCRVRAGLSKSVRLHYLLRKLLAGTLIVGSISAPVVFLFSGWLGAAFLATFAFPFLFWGGFIFLILFTSPLKIAKQQGDQFWLDGCSPEFLDSVKTALREAEPMPVV